MLKKIVVIAPIITVASLSADAQIVQGKNEIGLNIGTNVYQGDLAPSALGSLKTIKPQLGIYYNRIISPYFSLRANLSAGSLKGNESLYSNKAYMQIRNFNFTASLKELSALLVFSPYGDNGQIGFVKFSPYVFTGVAVSFLNINRDWSNLDISSVHNNSNILTGLAIDTLHATPTVVPVIPLGLGVKYALSQRIALTAETMYRYTFTDYLDGFKYAANPTKADSYYSFSIGLRYNFGKNKMKCPPVRR